MDPYQEFAEFYDVYVGERLDDLPLYLDVARSSRTPMLEIGAGSGRLTVPLAREGVPDAFLDRIYAPIGLDIGGRTPEEIALAIMAEIVNVRRKGRAPSLALRHRMKRPGEALAAAQHL